ncbi:unnamed protein product [Rotaria sp. Silwood1]|nr:unnamed protein product [Rotaria sp. Silwood1]
MAAALCSLAHYRQQTREIFMARASNPSSATHLTLIKIIRGSLPKNPIPSVSPMQNSVQPDLSTPSLTLSQQSGTNTKSDTCPYSDETLEKMESSVQNFIAKQSLWLASFTESDSIENIITTTVKYQSQVTQWYGTFTTFNILVRYRSNDNRSKQITVGHALIQYGLQLFRNLLIVKKIIEQTFSDSAVRFLLNDLSRLEKSFRSLQLDQCPELLRALQQLHVNICVNPDDFQPPSLSAAPKGVQSAKTKLNRLQQFDTASKLPVQRKSIPSRHDDKLPSLSDWKNIIHRENGDRTDDTSKLAARPLWSKPKSDDKNSAQGRIEALAKEMFVTNMNVMNSDSKNKTVDKSNSSLGMNEVHFEIDMEQQRKFMAEHLRQKPNLFEMYQRTSNKANSSVPTGKLDNRSALDVTGQKPNRWTYQKLVEIPSIAGMIDFVVEKFRLSWEKLINNRNSLEQHYIHWCILIDNSGSMSIHRNAIYESLVVLMESLRKLESTFAVARFGSRNNQKILKNLHELFTNQDGEYVLQALTFDEGTYPATGLARVAETVFPSNQPNPPPHTVIHRLVLMITDGLTDENKEASYSKTISDIIFPFNKFTRRRAALRGSSLYLPGVIKALTSEWSYKKIFSAKLVGGKRDHAVCFVLDRSTSMYGTLSAGLMNAMVVLMGALRKLEIVNIGIVVFGHEVHLIKTSEQNWDAMSIFTLMQTLRFDLDADTRDADAIEVAIDLLDQLRTRGEKKIFILTDGYSNCGHQLSLVQQRAEDHGIDLVAMAIGIDQTNLKAAYKRYLQCATVFGLPKAFRALFEQDNQLTEAEWPIKSTHEVNPSSPKEKKGTLFDDISSKKIFSDLSKELTNEREAMITASGSIPLNITVEICFCLDCTGSMSQWLAGVKKQMKTVIESIQNRILEEYSVVLQLRIAIVGYRDVNDAQQFSTLDFTVDTKKVLNFLNNLKAFGGGDLAEDVLGALDRCLIMDWGQTNIRFIVLITDAPGHGPELNDDPAIYDDPQVTSLYLKHKT